MAYTRETWKDAPGHEGAYEVSNLGRVRSVSRLLHYQDGRTRTLTGRIIKLKTDIRGLKAFHAGQGNITYAHRLIADVFVDNPNGYTKIRFKNGNRSDCRADNLEWVDQPFKRKGIQVDGLLFHVEAESNWLL